MRYKVCHADLMDALRATLSHLEDSKLVSADDPRLIQLKASIRDILAKDDARNDSDSPDV
jgi:hypothetical protein